MAMRIIKESRKTKETDISCEINIDGTGQNEISTGIGFFDHMLEIFSHHSLIDLKLKAEGDIHVDFHHTVEDAAYVLSEAINKAIGEKKGINRYGFFYIPMDESLSRTVIDFSGRPGVEYSASYPRQYINDFDVDLIHEFFQGFVNHALVTLHIDNLRGKNAHHQIETIFKAFGRAVRMAVEADPRQAGVIPSTKGTL